MKFLLSVLIVFTLFQTEISAQTKSVVSVNNATLDWGTNGTWSPSGVPTSEDITWANNQTDGLNVASGSYSAGSFSTANNGGVLTIANGATLNLASFTATANTFTINVNGTLNITGGLGAPQNLIINVASSGILSVGGTISASNNLTFNIASGGNVSASSFSAGNGADVAINGAMTVTGSFSVGGGSSSISVNGTLSAGSIDTSDTPITGGGTVTAGSCSNVPFKPATTATVTCNGDPLPVKLLFFRHNFSANNQLNLTWSTASEENFSHFELARSTNGVDFDIFGIVKSTGSNTTIKQNYSFEDQSPYNGINYYQLTSVDFDGYRETFDMIAVQVNQKLNPGVFPNPVTSQKFTIAGLNSENPIDVAIIGMDGKVYYSKQQFVGSSIELDNQLTKGLYVVRIVVGKQVFNERISVK
jgi:hypothetical protein